MAAVSKGHEVIVFFMDDGVRLLTNSSVMNLCENPGFNMSYCDYTVQKNGVSIEGCSGKILCGSQYNNAMMNHEADRIIVL
jgi:predicted peroxiredoxin